MAGAQDPGFIDYGLAGADSGFDIMDFIQKNSRNNLVSAEAPQPTQAAPQDPNAVAAQLVAADPSGQALDNFVQQYRTAYDNAVASENKRVERAGNPLNRVLSGITGVIGAPLKLADNALGGANWDITEPFRPKQTAKEIADQRILALADQRAGFEKDYASGRAERARLMGTLATNQREADQGVYNSVANFALMAATGSDPVAKAQFINNNVAELVKRNPRVGELIPGIGPQDFQNPEEVDQFIAKLVAFGDDATQKRFFDLNKGQNVPISQGGAVYNIPGVGGRSVTQYYQGGPVSQPQGAFGYAAPPEQAAALPAPAPEAQYEVPAANIPMGSPLDPNLANTPNISAADIDAELARRGIQ